MQSTLTDPEEITLQSQNVEMDRNVLEMYEALQNSVDTMDKKVEIVMKKHESQFLYAYRTHIKKIKKELEQIKNKSEEQERMFSANDRIRYLEKEVAVFREEAIKLYDKVEKKTEEFNLYKAKMKEVEINALKHQEENKQLSMKAKKMEALMHEFQRKIEDQDRLIDEQSEKILEYEKKLHYKASTRSFMESIKGRNINPEKYLASSPSKEINIFRNQLQQWFLECIRSVKKEVHQRKNNFGALDLTKITNISEFKLVDKLRLLELLLENQKLLNWFYHKLFPDRLDGLNKYLSQAATQPQINSSGTAKSGRSSQRYSEEELLLPKVKDASFKRSSAISVRNKVMIRNGKMNISMM